MSINEIIAIVGIMVILVTQIARLTYLLAQVRSDIDRLRKDYSGCYYARDHAAFERLCDERHSVFQANLDLQRNSLAQILKRIELLRIRLAVLGDALNGKRIERIAEDTES